MSKHHESLRRLRRGVTALAVVGGVAFAGCGGESKPKIERAQPDATPVGNTANEHPSPDAQAKIKPVSHEVEKTSVLSVSSTDGKTWAIQAPEEMIGINGGPVPFGIETQGPVNKYTDPEGNQTATMPKGGEIVIEFKQPVDSIGLNEMNPNAPPAEQNNLHSYGFINGEVLEAGK